MTMNNTEKGLFDFVTFTYPPIQKGIARHARRLAIKGRKLLRRIGTAYGQRYGATAKARRSIERLSRSPYIKTRGGHKKFIGRKASVFVPQATKKAGRVMGRQIARTGAVGAAGAGAAYTAGEIDRPKKKRADKEGYDKFKQHKPKGAYRADNISGPGNTDAEGLNTKHPGREPWGQIHSDVQMTQGQKYNSSKTYPQTHGESGFTKASLRAYRRKATSLAKRLMDRG